MDENKSIAQKDRNGKAPQVCVPGAADVEINHIKAT
jgi:hypothetical protein